MVVQQKTGRPVQFEITTEVRASLLAWLQRRGGTVDDYAFPSRVDPTDHLSTRQYARLVDEWVTAIGLRREDYGTHSLRRTKAAMIYKATGNLRAIQILLGHTKIENTVRYLGVESRMHWNWPSALRSEGERPCTLWDRARLQRAPLPVLDQLCAFKSAAGAIPRGARMRTFNDGCVTSPVRQEQPATGKTLSKSSSRSWAHSSLRTVFIMLWHGHSAANRKQRKASSARFTGMQA
jgi:hypothetical protein